MHPVHFVWLRVAVSFLVFCLIQLFTQEKFRQGIVFWKECLVLGLLMNAVPFLLISYGELFITSALAGILNGLSLLFTAIGAHFLGERLSRQKAIGVALGFLGLAGINFPALLGEGIGQEKGVVCLILSSLCYAWGTLYAKRHLQRVPGTVLLTGQLGFSTMLLLPFAFWLGPVWTAPSLASLSSVAGISLLGTVSAYLLYYKAIQIAGATYASLCVLLSPVIALLLGVFVLSEEISWAVYGGSALILLGVALIQPAFAKK